MRSCWAPFFTVVLSHSAQALIEFFKHQKPNPNERAVLQVGIDKLSRKHRKLNPKLGSTIIGCFACNDVMVKNDIRINAAFLFINSPLWNEIGNINAIQSKR